MKVDINKIQHPLIQLFAYEMAKKWEGKMDTIDGNFHVFPKLCRQCSSEKGTRKFSSIKLDKNFLEWKREEESFIRDELVCR